jgi:hypothetical protein
MEELTTGIGTATVRMLALCACLLPAMSVEASVPRVATYTMNQQQHVSYGLRLAWKTGSGLSGILAG